MSPASRRLLWYWLLLLLPTLTVGVGAFQLLRREQARLAAQEASAAEARRAAAANRAGLIVENIELLVGDVQTGLLETLSSMSSAGLDDELARWERSNPLVRAAFRCTPEGQLVFPPASAADEEARGFRRRFAPLFAGNPPWRQPLPAPALAADAVEGGAMVQKKPAFTGAREEAAQLARSAAPSSYGSEEERAVRDQVSSNISQFESARRDVRAISKNKDYLAESAATATAAAPAGAAEKSLADDFGRRLRAEADEAAAPEREGWTPWRVDGRLHLLGWIEKPALGEVRGVEIELAALIARLGATLPVETSAGEGYALRDDRGRTLHQVGWIPGDGNEASLSLPLFSEALPGWEVVAFLDAPMRADGAGAGFLVTGSLLTGILVVAILAGGALLLTQARRSEAEAAQKTSFVANVSHEFKTPLTTIRLYAELLEQGRVADGAKQRDYLQTIGRETQRLSRLVGNALDFSRLEQGKKKYERTAVDLAAALGQLLETHAPRLAEAGLKLQRDLPAGPVPVTTDRDAVDQIVLNLLDNAAKYAATGGEVTVQLAPRAGSGAIIRVLDRGPGVPAEHRERIFEKFHRVDDTLVAEQGGAGLGLSIARQLARGLGGELRFEPREGGDRGGGAIFVLELP